jgi:Amt family ammonium transporter
VKQGSRETKNTNNILFKNLMDFSIGSVSFLDHRIWPHVWGGNGFIGEIEWFSKIDHGASVGLPNMAFFFFQLVFAATAATIVSGAMAERTKSKLI